MIGNEELVPEVLNCSLHGTALPSPRVVLLTGKKFPFSLESGVLHLQSPKQE